MKNDVDETNSTTLTAEETIEAIRARIDGDFTNPALAKWGPLWPDELHDIHDMCDCYFLHGGKR